MSISLLHFFERGKGFALSAVALVLAGASPAFAQVVVAPTTPQVGSSNPATAEPLVPRPHTKPCTVSLFQNQEFADYNAKTFTYSPPANCPGPWSKVVFTADFTVTSGRQYDRTAQFYLGHVNLYYGTTAEPRSALSPSWHVEKDVTDLTTLLKTAQTGEADLGNFVGVYNGVTYDGIIYANAALEFYPASFRDPAPSAPDVIVPLPDAAGGAATLSTGSSLYTQQVTLPTNTEKVYLDVIAQSQSNDEFWYTCVPNDVASQLESCGATGFRETEISIDGTPAGVAPVYPWIYTGGIDPYLWEPIPGIQTLNFKPYRVDLTPFAGILSDGKPHSVSAGVFNANSYFLFSGTLLAYTDPHSSKITGGILRNDLAASPDPKITEKLTTDSQGNVSGTVSVASSRKYTISGYINTPHGRITTTVEQALAFKSAQQFLINETTFSQQIAQTTTADSTSTTQEGFFSYQTEAHFSYPFALKYVYTVNADGSSAQNATSDQQLIESQAKYLNRLPLYAKSTKEDVSSQDTLNYNSSGIFTGSTGAAATAAYIGKDTVNGCYSRVITAANKVLTSVEDDHHCGKDHR